MDQLLSQAQLHAYREKTFVTSASLRLKSREQAISFVNTRGFIFFWPIQGVLLPSLWVATAGDRPVADEHDDPGHITWSWKDELLGSRAWYYAKILRQKATMLSMELLPYFYALSNNYGSPEDDYLILYEQGRLTQEARMIYETLLENGSLDTIALRKAAHLSSQANESRFNKALADLQSDFKIVPVGVTQAGAWHYAHAYDLTTRHYPEIIDQTRFIDDHQARVTLLRHYFLSVGAAQLREIIKLFRWSPDETKRALTSLNEAHTLKEGIAVENQPGEWYALSGVFDL